MARDRELGEVGDYGSNEAVKAQRDQRHVANRADREEHKNKVLNKKVCVMIFVVINLLSFFKVMWFLSPIQANYVLINTVDQAPPGLGPYYRLGRKPDRGSSSSR